METFRGLMRSPRFARLAAVSSSARNTGRKSTAVTVASSSPASIRAEAPQPQPISAIRMSLIPASPESLMARRVSSSPPGPCRLALR